MEAEGSETGAKESLVRRAVSIAGLAYAMRYLMRNPVV
jgi:hypothetical protein